MTAEPSPRADPIIGTLRGFWLDELQAPKNLIVAIWQHQ